MGSDVDSPGPSDPLVGRVIAERYRLDELLGEGGMGKVYAAEHVLMHKAVAVKVLHPMLCEVPEVVARFEREAMATANVDHPNIASATDAGKLPEGSLFLVLELVRGKSLRDEIALGAMPVSRALHVARQIASALSAAHALGIVHRDLKPENVMLVSQGSDPDFVKVLDFGVAKVPPPDQQGSVGGPLTKLGVVFGTPEYMAPEQALGQSVDHRADLYALGVILYELVSGVRPFTAKSEAALVGQQLSKPVPPVSERAPGVRIPVRVEQLVQRLLAREVALRSQSADEVVQALDELLQPSNADARIFTQPDGSPTAFLGTAANLFAGAPPQVPALEPPSRPLAGGTLPLLDEGQARELAARVAAASHAEASPGPHEPAAVAPIARRAPASTRGFFSAACQLADDGRAKLPEGIRRPLAKVPASTLASVVLLAAGTVLFSMVTTVVWLAARPARSLAGAAASASAESAAPAPDPVLAELAAAKQQGHAALVKLAERHPKHPRVLFELAQSHAKGTDQSAAVATLGRALAEDPLLSAEPAAALLLAAAVRERATSGAALDLLEGRMGAVGAGVMYDLSIDDKLQASARGRAQKWVVQSPEFLKVASPSVEIAAKLRYGKSCTARHELLPRVAEVGDRRALAYLKIMKFRGGCGRRGRDDCFSCLRKDDALEQAIGAVEKRAKAGP